MEKENIKEIDFNSDGGELIKALNPYFDEKEKKVIVNVDEFEKVLNHIKGKGEKVIMQSGGELGLNIMLESRNKSIDELNKMAQDNLIFMRDNIPVKKMLGVE